jgi:hypothetical protein
MSDRHTSDPIVLPAAGDAYVRADLVFYGVDHSGPSFQARIFFDNTAADETTELTAEHGYAGRFHILGHGGCFGQQGHCEVPSGPRDPFDQRPAHQLTPVTKTVIVTDAVQRYAGRTVTITVVALVRTADGLQRRDTLHFDAVRLVTFE